MRPLPAAILMALWHGYGYRMNLYGHPDPRLLR